MYIPGAFLICTTATYRVTNVLLITFSPAWIYLPFLPQDCEWQKGDHQEGYGERRGDGDNLRG
jgi:hypothetical protein